MTKDEIEVYSSYEGEDIEILVRVDHYYSVPGTYNRQAETPDEYYGYEEIDYTVISVKNMETGQNLDESVLGNEYNGMIKEAIRESHDE